MKPQALRIQAQRIISEKLNQDQCADQKSRQGGPDGVRGAQLTP